MAFARWFPLLSVAVASPAMLADEGSCAAEGGACAGAAQLQPGSEHFLLQVGRASVRHGLGVEQEAGAQDEESQKTDDRCQNMRDVERRCSTDGCKVLATNMRHRSCDDYCSGMGYTCIGAWEEVEEDCRVKETLTCQDASVPTSDLICECSPTSDAGDADLGQSEPPLPSPGKQVPVSAFFWNVHWECSLAAHGAKQTCKQAIGQRFAELAREAGADIVVSIELSDTSSQPASLPDFGLESWTQVDGPCARGRGGDAAALAFAPSWQVEKSDGGCLRKDYDTRAFAVALVVPPSPVVGCPKLCVVAIHAPHTSINAGKDKVQEVCGDTADHCAIAMGDWNAPGHSVHRLWQSLIGGENPSAPQPDVRSCCWPETSHYGIFDHLATNVQGAVHNGSTVYPYQLLDQHPTKQHRAVSAKLLLPGV